MSEKRLQSDIVRKFSELYPLKRGQLFHVSNERNNKLQAFQAKANGIFNGVSDLIYFELNGLDVSDSATFLIGIEVKEFGSRHERDRIVSQVEWGKILELQGGIWRLCRSVDEAISCVNLDFKGLSISDVEKLLTEQKTKTIKF
jgi:hypothetical protein